MAHAGESVQTEDANQLAHCAQGRRNACDAHSEGVSAEADSNSTLTQKSAGPGAARRPHGLKGAFQRPGAITQPVTKRVAQRPRATGPMPNWPLWVRGEWAPL